MNSTGDQLFSGAGLTQYKHGRLQVRNFLYLIEDLLHSTVTAEDFTIGKLAGGNFPKMTVFFFQPLPLLCFLSTITISSFLNGFEIKS